MDEIVARAAVARASSQGESAFTFRLKRGLGQQSAGKWIHVVSVNAARSDRWDFSRDCGQARAGDALTSVEVPAGRGAGWLLVAGRRCVAEADVRRGRPFLVAKSKPPVPLASMVR
jgi:hypothetical protein